MEKTNQEQKKEYKSSFFGNNKTALGLLALAIAGAAIWLLYSKGIIGSKEAGDPSDPVAMVNGEQIKRSELEALEAQIAANRGVDLSLEQDKETKQQLQSEALDALIAQVLLRQEVENSGVSVSEEEINSKIETIKAQFENQQQYEEALSSQNVTEEQLRDQLNNQLQIENYLTNKVGAESLEATESEIEEFYQQSVSQQEGAPSLEEASSQIVQIITQQKQQQELQRIIQELRSSADIEILI